MPPPTILLAPLPLPLLMIFLWCYTSLKLQTNACSPPLSTLLPPIHYTILICSPHASQVFNISSIKILRTLNEQGSPTDSDLTNEREVGNIGKSPKWPMCRHQIAKLGAYV
ncbi:hypothetical protein B0H13DRAFT_1893452 [Mycena leptocephala]|nr:hypothetical protein B0H13DRAFT_1893452 [Mycena leptocephala]